MSIYHSLLSYSNPVLQNFRKIALKTGFCSPNRLRVLIFHDIPLREEKNFASQIQRLKKYWKIISPREFESMVSGDIPIIGDNLLITFDDGLISNRNVAEKFLNPMGIKAIFFVISDFASLENKQEVNEFIKNNIVPGSDISDIPQHWKNMRWSDLSALLEQGHTIGCHTKKHICLSMCRSNMELEQEIISSANKITQKLGNVVNHFAFPFGNIDSITKEALLIAKRRYRYIHSGIRGNNQNNNYFFVIRRDTASFQLSNNEYIIFNKNLLDSFLNGFADFHYSKSRKMIDVWSQ